MTTVFIISAPSGSGKSTLVSRLLASLPELMFSVSYTTRKPRGAEVAGQSYHFVSREDFEAMLARDEFLEWAQVFGNYYGTHRGILEHARASQLDLVLDIDVQGARQLKAKIPEAVTVFILAPSRLVLEQRLRARSEDRDDVIARRLREAAEEIRNYEAYDYVLINRELAEAEATLGAIVRAERARRSRIEDQIRPILDTFQV
jgi:guanylate kinase